VEIAGCLPLGGINIEVELDIRDDQMEAQLRVQRIELICIVIVVIKALLPIVGRRDII
jgi:hypothetical protein